MNAKSFAKVCLSLLWPAAAMAFGMFTMAAFGNGTPYYFDVNGTASGFGTASGNKYYDQEGQTAETTTLATGFGNGANVTSVVVANAANINTSMAFAGTGVPASAIVTSINGNTIGISSFTSTAASSGSYTFGSPETWTTSSAGTATPTTFPATSPYYQMTFGFSGTDLQGTFNVDLDGGPFNGIAINDSGIDPIFIGTSSFVYPSTSDETWTVASGSELTMAVAATPFDFHETVEGLQWGSTEVIFQGSGQIIFDTPLGCGDENGEIIEDMSPSGTVALDMAPITNPTADEGYYQGGFILNSGTLLFGSAGSAYQFFGFTPSGNPFQINGGTIENDSGSALTLNWAGGGGINMGGSFTVIGYPLSFGSAPVTLSTTPTITLYTTLTNGVTSGDGYGLTEAGQGTLVLPGNNTYSGATYVESGRLALAGSISNSPTIAVGGGAVFDVSGEPSPFSLADGQALRSTGGTGSAVLDGNFAGSGTVLAYYTGTIPFIITNGTMSVDGDFFGIDNYGPVLRPGAYCMITNSNPGFVEGTVASVSVDENGIVPGGTASMQTFGGALYLVVFGASTPTPVITGISVSGANLNITATNGTDGGFYKLYETANLNAPVKWTPVLTNRFDGSGNLNLSAGIINQSVHQEFYMLSQ
jgi:fibronectin-binding autotransporter adhesin